MDDHPSFALPVQYFCDATPPGVACREEDFERRELSFRLPLPQTALVLVDLWNVHHIDSWVEREIEVLKEYILPAIDAAHSAGMTIVQAPSPEVIRKQKYLQKRVHGGWTDHEEDKTEADWPPPVFLKQTGDYHAFRNPRLQPPGIRQYWDNLDGQLDISPLVNLEDTDHIVATGEQLQALFREKRILHILYAGFSTNWCILGRDYGLAAMMARGYNVILLRDATEGIEFPDTLEAGWATELAVHEVEQKYGFTAATADFIEACREVSD